MDYFEFGVRLGRVLENRRTFLKMPKEELARRMQVHSTSIRNWEKGRCCISAHNLFNILKIFEISLWSLKADMEVVDLGTETNLELNIRKRAREEWHEKNGTRRMAREEWHEKIEDFGWDYNDE